MGEGGGRGKADKLLDIYLSVLPSFGTAKGCCPHCIHSFGHANSAITDMEQMTVPNQVQNFCDLQHM